MDTDVLVRQGRSGAREALIMVAGAVGIFTAGQDADPLCAVRGVECSANRGRAAGRGPGEDDMNLTTTEDAVRCSNLCGHTANS